MRYLSIDGLRTEQWECAVRDKNLANVHMKSDCTPFHPHLWPLADPSHSH